MVPRLPVPAAHPSAIPGTSRGPENIEGRSGSDIAASTTLRAITLTGTELEVSVGQHVIGLLFLLLIVLGPVPLSLCSVLGSQRERRGGGAAHGLLLLLSWCVVQAVIAVGLGATGHLSRPAILLSEAAVLALGIAVLLRSGADTRASLRGALALRQPLQLCEAVIVVSLVGLFLSLLWHCGSNPITDPDSLAYHMPAMARWYQSGTLGMPSAHEMPKEHEFLRHYPYGWEAICFLFLVPFREDFSALLPTVLAWALLGLSIYCLGRDCGASRPAGLGAASLALSIPVLVSNINTMQVDLPLTAFVMAGLCVGLRYARLGPGRYLGLFLASAGMMASIKSSGLLYAALLTLVIIGGRIRARSVQGRPSDVRAAPALPGIALTMLGGCSALLIAGFWYLRNWREVGNPFGPVAIRLGGFIELPGKWDLAHLRRTTLASVFAPWSYVDWQILLGQIWERFGLPFVILILLAVAALVSLAAGRRVAARGSFLGLLCLAAVTASLYTVTPYSGDNGANRWLMNADFVGHNMRFALPFCAATAAAAAVGSTVLRLPGIALAPLALAGMLGPLLALGMTHIPVIALAVFLLAARPRRWLGARIQGTHTRRALPLAFALIAVVALYAATFAARRLRDDRRRVVHGGIQHYIAEHVGADETIGYFMSNRSYLLYGKDFSREVVYIPLESRDCREWLDYLDREEIAVVAAGPAAMHRDAWETFDWLERGRMPFIRVFGADFHRQPFLYRVAEELVEASECGRALPPTPPSQQGDVPAHGNH